MTEGKKRRNNIHTGIDRISTGIGSLYGEKVRFFREGIESPRLIEIPAALEMDFSGFTEEGEYRIPVRFGRLEGTARYFLIHRAGPHKPSLIFHHGSGETNYTSRIRRILPEPFLSRINLIALSIPWNRNMKEYVYGIGSLERFAFLLASSVMLMEFLGRRLREMGSGKLVASGISLGGWITNLHYSIYGSLDEYRPIFAGAALDHLFTDTVYRSMISREAGAHPEVLRRVLNFEDLFRLRDPRRVFPLLARYDQYIKLERQRGIYLEEQISILEKGHITGAMDRNALREHLLHGLEQDHA